MGNYIYDVSIVIVNYNGKRYIDDLFESLKHVRHEGFSFEVVFVDNNSSDDSVAYLESKRKEFAFPLKIVKSKTNTGFAGGNNIGAKVSKGEYIVLLNNDTKVEPDWLQELFYFIKDRACVTMVNSKLLFYYDFIELSVSGKIFINRSYNVNGEKQSIDNKYCKAMREVEDKLECSAQTRISLPLIYGVTDYVFEIQIQDSLGEGTITLGNQTLPVKNGTVTFQYKADEIEKNKYALIQNAGSGVNEAFDGYDIGSGEKDGEAYSKPYKINNACGASVMMRRDDFFRSGMFDRRFFMYYEDTDLCYRMKRNNQVIMYCPTSVVRHIHTGSSTEWSPFFTYHVYRNKLLFVFKNISKKLFLKQLIILYRQGKRENNFYKMCGCKDALKIVMKKKANTQFRW